MSRIGIIVAYQCLRSMVVTEHRPSAMVTALSLHIFVRIWIPGTSVMFHLSSVAGVSILILMDEWDGSRKHLCEVVWQQKHTSLQHSPSQANVGPHLLLELSSFLKTHRTFFFFKKVKVNFIIH